MSSSNLITCDKLIKQLVNRLMAASPQEKQQVVELLGLNSNNLKDCKGYDLPAGSKVPTCEQMHHAIKCAVGATECTYKATVQVTFGGDECGVFRRVGWLFADDDEQRDPAANVKFTDCQGNIIGWAYPDYAKGRLSIVDGCSDNETVLGYALSVPEVRTRIEDCNCQGN